jgi:hypothetical protein
VKRARHHGAGFQSAGGLFGRLLLCTALVWAADVALASDQQIDRESLRALYGVRVVVEDLPANAPIELVKDLGSTEALRKSIEAKLEAAHVPTLNQGEFPVGDPFLRISIKTTPETSGLIAYRVAVDFVQIVFVRRNPQLTFNRAQTWAAEPQMGIIARKDLAGRIKRDLDAQLDQFIAAYKSVNSN